MLNLSISHLFANLLRSHRLVPILLLKKIMPRNRIGNIKISIREVSFCFFFLLKFNFVVLGKSNQHVYWVRHFGKRCHDVVFLLADV